MGIFDKKKKTGQPDRPRELPAHIAIIMDGNGRWAKKRGLPRTAGHAAGAETFRSIANYCKKIGVKYLTVYAFSTENWKRSEEEVSAIMGLLTKYLQEILVDMDKNQVKFVIFGDLERLSLPLQQLARETQQRSAKYEGVQVNFCINYGGRDEIVRGIQQFAKDCLEGKCQPEDLDETLFSQYLCSRGVPDPDLVIRPSGEIRISNFLLWQSAYAEYYFTDVLWPDFKEKDLELAIAAYQKRSRRFGGVTK